MDPTKLPICVAYENSRFQAPSSIKMRSPSTSSSSSSSSQLWGCFFVTIGSVFFVGFLFAAVISKLLPPSRNALISSIQNDWYYCFLVPLTLPVLVVAVYFHWISMKLFKHA